MKRISLWLLLLGETVRLCACGGNCPSPRMLVVNEDNDHYFKLCPTLMTEEALKSYIDRMAQGKVTHLFMCPSGQRTSYGSKVWEPIWLGLDEPGGRQRGEMTRWAENAKSLHDRGIDPYRVWIERCRLRGISPWISPRMNDVHNKQDEWPFRNTTFWKTRTDLHCNTNKLGRGSFNFALDEVQDYTFALVREQVERYDVDGIELDFMRSAPYFPKGTGAANAHHLSRFVRRTRILLDETSRKRGRRILLGVRVPTTPQASLAIGADVFAWAAKGWIDVVCASDGWMTPDYNTPVDAWRKGLGKARNRVMLLVGCDHGISPYGDGNRVYMTPQFYAGFADVVWNGGADGVYLFNAIYRGSDFEEVCAKGLMPEELGAYSRRRYPVSFRRTTYGAAPNDLQLPRKTDRRQTFRVRLGDNVKGTVSVVLGTKGTNPPAAAIRLNGKAPDRSVEEDLPLAGHNDRRRVFRGRRYFFADGAAHPGPDNIVETEATSPVQTIDWVEIDFDAKQAQEFKTTHQGE